MLTESQNTELNNFNAAKEIALSIESKCYRKAYPIESPFYGANFPELGPVVLWKETEGHLTNAASNGKIELDKTVYFFRRVAEYTILEG